MDDTNIQLPLRHGEIPRFWGLGEYRFQELCCELYDREPKVSECREYGTRGQRQFGIDLIAPRRGSTDLETSQVKCYEDFSDADIRAASDEFLKFKKKWLSEGVKKFVVMVACVVKRTECVTEINKQRQKFLKIGIEYEFWDAVKIRDKLRPYPLIVQGHLEDPWAEDICGSKRAAIGHDLQGQNPTQILTAELSETVKSLTGEFSEFIEKLIQDIRLAWRRGKVNDAITWIEKTKNDQSTWDTIDSELKARILRIEAGISLDVNNDISRAELLVTEAKSVFPTDNQNIIKAHIAFAKGDTKTALNYLRNSSSEDELNLKAALQLVSKNVNASIQTASQSIKVKSQNAEAYRVRALAKLANREVHEALQDAETAFKLDPKAISVRSTTAIILYYSALINDHLPMGIEQWPEPTEWHLLRNNDHSIESLRRAENIFGELIGIAADKEEKENLQIWQLACLACDPDQQSDAESYCWSLISKSSNNYKAISWALTRGYHGDFTKSISSLSEKIDSGSGSIGEVIGLIACFVSGQFFDEALNILRKSKQIFKGNEGRELWQFWLCQLLVLSGKPKKALQYLKGPKLPEQLIHAKSLAFFEIGKTSGDWSLLKTFLFAVFSETNNSKYLLHYCELCAENGEWGDIADQRNLLVELVGTPDAVQLAAIACFNNGQYEDSISILDKNTSRFRGENLPRVLRHLRITCHQMLGRVTDAVQEAEKLVADDDSATNLIRLGQAYFFLGDIQGTLEVGTLMSDMATVTIHDNCGVKFFVTFSNSIFCKAVDCMPP